jgi:hypothetical protein
LLWFGNSNRALSGRTCAANAANRRRPAKRRNRGGFFMTEGEIAFLSLVLVVFGAFFLVIGVVSQKQDKRRGQ